jgi:hypothetical protein
MIACGDGNTAIVRALVNAKADPNVVNKVWDFENFSFSAVIWYQVAERFVRTLSKCIAHNKLVTRCCTSVILYRMATHRSVTRPRRATWGSCSCWWTPRRTLTAPLA